MQQQQQQALRHRRLTGRRTALVVGLRRRSHSRPPV